MFKIGNRAIYQSGIYAAINEAKKNGFAVLEIHLTSPHFLPYNYSKRRLAEIKSFAKKQDIILQIHAPLEYSLIFTSLELRQAAKNQLKTMIEFGREISAQCLTLHPGKVAIYHTSDGEKLKDDELFPKFYSDLFEDSIKHIISVASEDIFVCIENTDNFTLQYQKVLDKYLPTGKVFLTWDIRKNYTYTTNELIEKQWDFVKRNKNYVKNLHISGFNSVHGSLKKWEDKLDRFIELFSDKELPMVIEILPLESAVESKKTIEKILCNFENCFYEKTLDYWNFRAGCYLKEIKPKVANEIIGILKNKNSKKIIDIGCGPAHYALDIKKALPKCNMTCVDFSPKMITAAKNNISKECLINDFEFIQGNIAKIKFKNNYFDAALAISVCHHLLPVDIKKVCEKIYRSLKQKGIFIVVEYWAKEKLNTEENKALIIANKNRSKKGFNATLFKESDYINLFWQVGFKVIRKINISDHFYPEKYLKIDGKFNRPEIKINPFVTVTLFELKKYNISK